MGGNQPAFPLRKHREVAPAGAPWPNLTRVSFFRRSYLNQPRVRKYKIIPIATATIKPITNG